MIVGGNVWELSHMKTVSHICYTDLWAYTIPPLLHYYACNPTPTFKNPNQKLRKPLPIFFRLSELTSTFCQWICLWEVGREANILYLLSCIEIPERRDQILGAFCHSASLLHTIYIGDGDTCMVVVPLRVKLLTSLNSSIYLTLTLLSNDLTRWRICLRWT